MLEQILYSYERSTRKSAGTAFLNASICLGGFIAFDHFYSTGDIPKGTPYWIAYILIGIALGLFFLAWYLYSKNDRFLLRLTDKRLHLHDPAFGAYTWEVKLDDIKEIRENYSATTGYSNRRVYLKNGDFKQLTMNHMYSFKKLCAEIKKHRPDIITKK